MVPLTCDREQFVTICSDLLQFGKQGHECLNFIRTTKGYYPVTFQQSTWISRTVSSLAGNSGNKEEDAESLIKFFEVNKEYLLNQEATLRSCKKIAKGLPELKDRFHKLIKKSIYLKAQESIEDERTKILEKAQQEKLLLEQSVNDTIKEMYKEAEKMQNSMILQKKVELKRLEEKANIVQKRLEFVNSELNIQNDVVIRCANGTQIFTQLITLQKIPYFNTSQNILTTWQIPHLTYDITQMYPNLKCGFYLKEYSMFTIQQFLNFLVDPTSIDSSTDVEELYKLAKLISYEPLIKACQAIYEKHKKEQITNDYKIKCLLKKTKIKTNYCGHA